MEEILDFEELNEDIVDENLKDFMKKDEETEQILNDKINELASLEEQLTAKENELKTLDESNREKISTNASADDLIKLAQDIKEVEEELLSIKSKIEKLLQEKEEIVKTKEDIVNSKKEYIKTLKNASLNYDTQLRKISEAIEVCDNPGLKQVLQDVQSKRSSELSGIEEKRVSELRNILNEADPVKEEKIELDVSNVIDNVPIESNESINLDENINNEEENIVSSEKSKTKIDIPNEINVLSSQLQNEPLNIPSEPYSPKSLDDLLLNPLQNQEVKPIVQEETISNSNMINLDDILTESSNNLNEVKTDDLVLPDVNILDNSSEEKIKIIYKKDVSSNLLREIYSSSKIMPSLYNYLEGSIN